MTEQVYISMFGTVCHYCQRMHVGPALQEHEFLLYQELCHTIQAYSTILRQGLEKGVVKEMFDE